MLTVLDNISYHQRSDSARTEKMSCGVKKCGHERKIDIQRICTVKMSIDLALLETQEPKPYPVECAVAKYAQIGWRSNDPADTRNALPCQGLVYLGAVGGYHQTVWALP